MTALTIQQRAEVHAALMRDESATFGPLTKLEFRAAVDALDAFFEVNVAAINAAFPLPARTALTAAQKSKLVRYVIEKRYG